MKVGSIEWSLVPLHLGFESGRAGIFGGGFAEAVRDLFRRLGSVESRLSAPKRGEKDS